MSVVLSKHEAVLELQGLSPLASHVQFGAEFMDDPATDRFELPRGLWYDMGRPTTITLTVTPGDELNAR